LGTCPYPVLSRERADGPLESATDDDGAGRHVDQPDLAGAVSVCPESADVRDEGAVMREDAGCAWEAVCAAGYLELHKVTGIGCGLAIGRGAADPSGHDVLHWMGDG
jgi:hypothetical protein